VSNHESGYQVQIRIKGKKKYLGLFNTAKQAAIAYDHAVHKHRLLSSWLNFPTMKHNLNKEPKGRKKQKVSATDGFRGVSKNKKGYRARLYFNGKQHNLGTFDTANEAARAYDQASQIQQTHRQTKLSTTNNKRYPNQRRTKRR
jgi:hypothetical protein